MTKVKELESGISMQNLNSEVIRLYLLAKINPEILEMIHPKGPKYSRGALDVFAAQIIKAIIPSVKKSALKSKLNKIGKELFDAAKSKIDYVDDLCPFPFPSSPLFPFPEFHPFPLWWWFSLNPQPQPPSEMYLGGILLLIGESVSNDKIKNGLIDIAKQIGGNQ
jgi:hypothetical protein